MITTQRLFIFVFVLSLLFGSMSYMRDNNSFIGLDTELDDYDGYSDRFYGQDAYSGVTNRDYDQESSVGNPIEMTGVLWDMVKRSINPFSLKADQYSSSLESNLVKVIGYFRVLLMFLVMVELVMFLKNKKTS